MLKMKVSIVLLLVMMVVMPMLMKGPDGKPIMDIYDWIPRQAIDTILDSTNSVGHQIENVNTQNSIGAGDEIYTWRDADGVLHYSDKPVNGSQAMTLPENATMMEAVKVRSWPKKTDSKPKRGTVNAIGADQIEAVMNGDMSQAGELIKNLPEMIENAKQARSQVLGE